MSSHKLIQFIWAFIAIVFAVVFPHLGLIPSFTYCIPVLLLVVLVLKTQNSSLTHLGIGLQQLTKQTVIYGILLGIVAVAISQLVLIPVLSEFLTAPNEEVALYSFAKEGIVQLLFLIVMSWIIGGLYEEVVFHGFIFHQIKNWFPSSMGTAISFILTGLLFGVYHYQLGWIDMLNAWGIGMLYCGIYLYFKKNLWYAVFAHGTFNSIVLSLLYMGYIG